MKIEEFAKMALANYKPEVVAAMTPQEKAQTRAYHKTTSTWQKGVNHWKDPSKRPILETYKKRMDAVMKRVGGVKTAEENPDIVAMYNKLVNKPTSVKDLARMKVAEAVKVAIVAPAYTHSPEYQHAKRSQQAAGLGKTVSGLMGGRAGKVVGGVIKHLGSKKGYIR